MKAIILAAGRGSRMKGWTEELPKCMLELDGKPLLQHQVDAMQASGIHEIAVVTGYRKEKLKAHGITHRFENLRWQETNMVRSLMAANAWLTEQPCIISYGDIFYAPSAPKSLGQSTADIAITYDINFWELWSRRFSDPLADLENFRVDAQGYVTDIGGRAKRREDIEGQYMGLLMIRPQGWKQITAFLQSKPSEVVDKMDMTSLLRELIIRKMRIQGIAYHDSWGEVDVPDDLALYTASF